MAELYSLDMDRSIDGSIDHAPHATRSLTSPEGKLVSSVNPRNQRSPSLRNFDLAMKEMCVVRGKPGRAARYVGIRPTIARDE
jgi:hypothetical protein